MNTKKQIRKRVTLKDVASALSVTPATISKALSNSTDISHETKERVKKVSRELGYRPNLLARSLINNRSRILGVLVPDLQISFFSEALRGMYEEAGKKNYECLFLVHDENADKERKKLEFLSDIHADGILLNPAAGRKNYGLYRKMTEEGIRIVCWDRDLDGLGFRSVKIDDVDAGFKLTSKLIAHGRKNILFIGPTALSVAEDRFKGHKMALEENGIDFRPELVVHSYRSVEDGQKKMLSILDKGIEIDGVVSMGGLVVYGVGRALIERNLSIPEDVVIGEFGDNDIAYKLGVPFYTVFQNPYEIGQASTDLIIKMIETKKMDQEFRDIVIDSEVIERKPLRIG